MRIRTLLAAAVAPAALAAVLLGTAGQASAAVAAPTQATLTASMQQAGTVTAIAHEQNAPDTTNVAGTGTHDSNNGPQWAWDNMTRKITATPNADGTTTWQVRVDSQGSFAGFANPIDGSALANGGTLAGSVKGWVNYTVTSAKTPSAANINGNLPDGTTSTAMLKRFFGDPGAQVVGENYQFNYSPIPVPADHPDPAASTSLGITWGLGPNGLGYQQAG